MAARCTISTRPLLGRARRAAASARRERPCAARLVPELRAHSRRGPARTREAAAARRARRPRLRAPPVRPDGRRRPRRPRRRRRGTSTRPTTRPPAERLAVVATGGYGRGTLAPGSDVDLLFLLPYKQTAWGESVVEAMLYVLWDLKLKVGHATRSVDECMREARADMTIRTALLEARFLLGDRALFDELRDPLRQGGRARPRRRSSSRPSSRSAMPASPSAGASRYLVEPNVKDGKGGLRDLNTLFWIAKYVYRVREPKELVAAGLFTRGRVPAVRRAARNSSGACAATCISSPAAPRSG